MMFNYFWSSLKRNAGKTTLLILSVAVFFFLVSLMLTVGKNMDAIASLPFRAVGVDAVVQKMGQIPEQMAGVVYPHANGPIYPDEVSVLSKLNFVTQTNTGLYFWYFDGAYFKDVFGIRPDDVLFSAILKNNLEAGNYSLGKNDILITKNFARKNFLSVGSDLAIGQNYFTVAGILRPDLTGNIVPAGIYMNYDTALAIAQQSAQMQKIYRTDTENFVNVVLLKTQPQWRGDIQKTITAMNKDYLVFSQETFSTKLMEQIKLISSFGQAVFLVLGILLLFAYGFLVLYYTKTREGEIAILRIVGWSIKKIRGQFIAESLILIVCALLLGNIFTYFGVYMIGHTKITMTIPWEISAKPHFLPQENNIDRAVTGTIPVSYNWLVLLSCSLAFIAALTLINYLLFKRIKNIKPDVRSG